MKLPWSFKVRNEDTHDFAPLGIIFSVSTYNNTESGSVSSHQPLSLSGSCASHMDMSTETFIRLIELSLQITLLFSLRMSS